MASMDQRALTYAAVGCTRTGVVPAGFDELRRSRRVGRGWADFERAADALLTWQMHRRAGLAVTASHERVETGAVAELRLGVGRLGLRAPVRVVDVVDEPTRRGFAYGTLPGHPESGEESFVVELGETGDVTLTITAVSRPTRPVADHRPLPVGARRRRGVTGSPFASSVGPWHRRPVSSPTR